MLTSYSITKYLSLIRSKRKDHLPAPDSDIGRRRSCVRLLDCARGSGRLSGGQAESRGGVWSQEWREVLLLKEETASGSSSGWTWRRKATPWVYWWSHRTWLNISSEHEARTKFGCLNGVKNVMCVDYISNNSLLYNYWSRRFQFSSAVGK